MIVPGSANSLLLAQGAATGYNLTKSLRFRSSAGAYMNRSQISSNRQKWTFSFWMKRGALADGNIYATGGFSSGQTYAQFYFSSNQLNYIDGTAGVGNNIYLTTTQVFRDPSAWYHIVIATDTTQSTASNRVKIYVNGVQVTAFSNSTYPSQNYNTRISDTTAPNDSFIGALGSFDGYFCEFNAIDGQQLTPSSFGENNATTGVWQPIRYTGTYGTNGFYLPFTDTTSTTTLGYDSSGNGNNWTVNNISLTAGSTYDSMTDVPTLTSATTANYAVLNPLNAVATVSNGNLSFLSGSSTWLSANGTVGISSGKYYWEVTYSGTFTYGMVGIALSTQVPTSGYPPGTDNYSYGYISSSGNKFSNGGTSASYGSSWTTGDVIGVALDMNAGTLTFYKNNTSQGTAFTGLSGTFMPSVSSYNATGYVNFGQQPFTYTPPTGYVALNTYNLSAPTISNGRALMDATTYTGTGAVQSITNNDLGTNGFKPDLVWLKSRSRVGSSHYWFDSVRGVNDFLSSDSTAAESTVANTLTSFNSDGFTLGSIGGDINANGSTFVGWQWQAGQGTNTTNTSGSITSTVSANATAGFSIVTYTGTGIAGTIGHGLGIAPSFIVVKNRTTGGTDWYTKHSAYGANDWYQQLNLTSAVNTSTAVWNNTAPTSSVFSVGSSGATNNNGDGFVAYCWAQIAGFSAFGSYTGNGSTDGPFIYTGFRPRYVMIKATSSVSYGYWMIHDTARGTYNVVNQNLYANYAYAEDTDAAGNMDILSNGFKLRGTVDNANGNGSSYIYMAFAENPFKYALAR